MTAATQLQLRRGTSAQVATFTGAQGELVVDVSSNRLVLQDGSTAGGFTVGSPGVSANILNSQTGNYTIQPSDTGATIYLTGGLTTLTVPAVTGFASNAAVDVVNGDAGRGKIILGLAGLPLLMPTQTFTIKIVAGSWVITNSPHRWQPTANVSFYVSESLGNDANDGLATGAGAFQTAQGAIAAITKYLDFSAAVTATINVPGAITSAFNVSGPWVGGNTNGAACPVIIDGNNTGSITSSTNAGLISATERGIIQVQNMTLNVGSGGFGLLAHYQGHIIPAGNITIIGASGAKAAIFGSGDAYYTTINPWVLNLGGSYSAAVFQILSGCTGAIEHSTINIIANISYPAFVNVSGLATFNFNGTPINNTGSYTTTGRRFTLSDGGRTVTNLDDGNLLFFPGDTAGLITGTGFYDELPPVIGPAQMAPALVVGGFADSVNFNSANTDTAITITLPAGVTNYVINSVRIGNASGSLTTATAGMFTAAGGTGTAIVAAASAITVSSGAANTANNAMSMTLAVSNVTQSFNVTTLYFRVANPQGVAATGSVVVYIIPLP